MPTVQVDIVLKTSLQLDLGELKRAIDLVQFIQKLCETVSD